MKKHRDPDLRSHLLSRVLLHPLTHKRRWEDQFAKVSLAERTVHVRCTLLVGFTMLRPYSHQFSVPYLPYLHL